MMRHKVFCGGLLTCMLLGCQVNQSGPHPQPAQATPAAAFLEQAQIKKIATKSGSANPDRSLIHVSHTCNLRINGERYAVVDMRELVKGAMSARGVNSIVLLDPAHQPVQKIEYGQARPLFCESNKLYLYGDIVIDGRAEEGNVLQFGDGGYEIDILREDLNKKLPL